MLGGRFSLCAERRLLVLLRGSGDLVAVSADDPPGAAGETLTVGVARVGVLREPVQGVTAVGCLQTVGPVDRAELGGVDADPCKGCAGDDGGRPYGCASAVARHLGRGVTV